MHILHLSAVKNWGGGENHIENLCSELKESNPEIKNTIFCVKNGAFHKRLEKTKLNFITARLKTNIDLRFSFKLGVVCRKEKIDLIHIHDPNAILLAIISDKIFNLPPFIFSKKTSFPIKQRKKTLFKYNYPKIKKVLCVSEETKRISSEGIKDYEKLITVYHGTNLKTKSTKTPFLLREKFNISSDKIIIGNIANHIRAKHLDTLVDIADTIVNKEKRTDFIFIQIGTFTDRTPDLLQRVNSLKLEKHLIFMDYTPNASNFLPQFNISLITSQSEGIPQVIYESMFHRVPLISTNVGGIPEIIEDKKTGLLAPMHDYKSLSNHILSLSENSHLQKEFTDKAYQKLINKYTNTNMAMQTLAIYKEIITEY